MRNLKNKIVLLSLLVAFLIASCKKKQLETTEVTNDKSTIHLSSQQTKTIGTDTVKYTYGQDVLSLTGKVSFDEDRVAKVFPLASGNVIKVNVSLGDHVKKGQILAILRSSEVNDYQSQYDMAQANLALAKHNLENAEELFKTNYYSQSQVLSARNDYKKAQSDVDKLKQQLEIYGAKTNKIDAEYRLEAPIDGYIVEKNINENMQVRSDNGTSLFTVSNLNTVWVLADVYESDLSKVHIGDPVDITTVAYPDKVFSGIIKQISTLLDPVTKTLKLRVVLDNKDDLLKPEMFAIVKVHSQNSEKFLTIPSKALVFDNSQYTVIVVKNDTTFQKRPIKILRNEGDRTLVLEGLKPGERIVTDGSLLVSFTGQ